MTRPLSSTERQRLRTPANLWRALIPLLVVVGVLVLFQRAGQPTSDGVHVVDTSGPIAAARQQAGFPLQVPVGLPASWRPTSTEFVPASSAAPASFRIGYVTPAGKYAEFLESNDAADAVAAQYGPLTADGTSTIGGASWIKERTSDDKTLLRHTGGTVTVLVTGNADLAELQQLAAALR
ncbi:MAG TPA: DUF4245 domain-containing protein [Jatrophihabitans sp.]|nr:DUF4245 domain-containing protein [Jatrophihabitans sp.]